MEERTYFVHIGTKVVELHKASDAFVVSQFANELEDYRSGRFGYVLPPQVLWSLIVIACAIDTAIVIALYKLLG